MDSPFDVVLTNRPAEQAVLGGLMLHPERFLVLQGQISCDDFAFDGHRKLYAVLLEMYLAGEALDLPPVAQKATSRGVSALVVSECADAGIEYRGKEWAAKATRELRRRRDLQATLFREAQRLGDLEHDPFQALLDVALEQKRDSVTVVGPKEAAEAQFAEMERRKRDGVTHVSGLRTGFGRLDYHLGGLCGSRLLVLSGPTGHGKTKIALNWLHTICVAGKVPGLFISAEMRPQDIVDRMTCIGSGESHNSIRQGEANKAVMDAINSYFTGGLYVADNTPATVHDIALLILKYKLQHGIKIWVYDYLGLMARDNPKMREDRDERFGRYVKTLRDMAVRTDTHGIIVCQVNRQDQVAESKKIENDADHILHFQHDKGESAHVLELRKNRFGPDGFRYLVHVEPENHRMTEGGILREATE